MKNRFLLPLSALLVLLGLQLLTMTAVLPAGESWLSQLANLDPAYLVAAVFIVILLESVVYVGFYLPGQMIAVILVLARDPGWQDIGLLTLVMVLAATLGSIINYFIGWSLSTSQKGAKKTTLRSLLPAMIHINALAFFMFHQGLTRSGWRIVLLAGLLNLPYYLLIISVTVLFKNQVLAVAENPVMLAVLVLAWLVVAVIRDCRDSSSWLGRMALAK